MKRSKHVAIIEKAAWTFAMGLLLVAGHSASGSAAQSPRQGCVAISKQEYDSAKRRFMLRSRFGTYVRTGRIGRRQYSYCQP
jgi:hypothetical protein